MKKFAKCLSVFLVLVVAVCVGVFFAGCSSNGLTFRSIEKIEKTSTDGLVDTYTIYYTDGTTDEYTVKNGEDGKNGTAGENGVDGKNGENGVNGKDGVDGKDGEDGKDGKDGLNGHDGEDGEDGVTDIEDIYAYYVENVEDISFADFLEKFLSVQSSDNSRVVAECLKSSLKIYTEFAVTTQYLIWPNISTKKSIGMYCGSGVVFDIDDNYVYVITNYHVVYNANANEDNGGKIARKIYGYLYGSEDSPVVTTGQDALGYDIYNYGAYGIALEYVGGSIDQDIAVLRANKADVVAINPDVKAAQMADEYHVGETAIAIGNPENYGISVTQGVVSVDNENISLAIDGTTRAYRSIRIDTSIYGGSSGGGLFNKFGQLIGITNAGNTEDQNINYAIPIDIVKNTVENILRYYDGTNSTTVKKMLFGITVTSQNSKYVYDAASGYGKIVEDTVVQSVSEGSIAETLGLMANDKILSIIVNETKFEISRYFEIGDLLLTVFEGDKVVLEFERGGDVQTTAEYTVLASDIN